MNTNDLYYKKYLKYKSKYLELRGSGQIGGLKPCPFFKLLTSPYELIKSHDCKYPQLKEKFKDFTYAKFLKSRLTIQDLKDKDFPLDFFLDRRYPKEILVVPYIDILKDGYSLFTLEHFEKAKCDVAFLKTKMYTIRKLILIGFSALEIRNNFTLDEIINAIENMHKDISLSELKKLGFILNELIKWRKPCDFKINGYTLQELKNVGFTALYLRLCYDIKDFIKVGYTINDLLIFSYDDLLSNGFTAQQILDAITIEYNNDKYNYNNIRSVLYFRMKGISAAKLKEKGFNIIYFKEAGFNVQQLISDGFSLTELKTGGFTASELKSYEYGVAELKNAGFGVKELKKAGFDIEALKSAGFSESDLKSARFSKY